MPRFPVLEGGDGTADTEGEEGLRRGQQGLYKQFLASAVSDASTQWEDHLRIEAQDQLVSSEQQPQQQLQQQDSTGEGEHRPPDPLYPSPVRGAGDGACAGGDNAGGGGSPLEEVGSPATRRHVHFGVEPEARYSLPSKLVPYHLLHWVSEGCQLNGILQTMNA